MVSNKTDKKQVVKLAQRALLTLAVGLTLSACEYEETPVSLAQKSTDIASTIPEVSAGQEAIKKVVQKQHQFDFNGEQLMFDAIYGIDEQFASSWYYTIPNTVDLEVKTSGLPAGVEVAVNNLYADVTISSRYSRFNGIRQDSLNLSYSSVGESGFSFSDTLSYRQPFQIEGINQSEVFLGQWNGYGNTHHSYLTENEVRKYSDGIILRVVWLISLKRSDSDQIFSTTLTDNIYIKSPEYVEPGKDREEK